MEHTSERAFVRMTGVGHRYDPTPGSPMAVQGIDLDIHRQEAMEHHLVHHVVADAGRTEVAPGTVTVLGIGPAQSSVLDVLVGHLQAL